MGVRRRVRRLQLGFAELEHDAQSAALRRVRQRALAEIRRRELLDGLLLLALAETEEQAHAALDDAARRLADMVSGTVAICELGLSPNGRVLVIWKSAAGDFPV